MRGTTIEPKGRANIEGNSERRGLDLDTARPGSAIGVPTIATTLECRYG